MIIFFITVVEEEQSPILSDEKNLEKPTGDEQPSDTPQENVVEMKGEEKYSDAAETNCRNLLNEDIDMIVEENCSNVPEENDQNYSKECLQMSVDVKPTVEDIKMKSVYSLTADAASISENSWVKVKQEPVDEGFDESFLSRNNMGIPKIEYRCSVPIGPMLDLDLINSSLASSISLG